MGVVIDDLVCFEKVLSSNLVNGSFAGRSQLDDRMDAIMMKYDAVHLPTNGKKAFDNAVQSSFWGVQLDGVRGLMRPNESRLWPLVLITMRVCSLGLATVGLLRSLAGSYVSVFALRRRLLAIMNLIFDAISASRSDRQVVRLSGPLRDELFAMMLLAPLAVVNLRARTIGTLRATDSSNWGMAAVSSEIPVMVAKEAMRLSLCKSRWTKLLPASKAWLRLKGMLDPADELPDEEVYDVHPFWEQLGRSLRFKEEWRKPHPKPVHINIGELRACLLEESRLSLRHLSVRVPFALDSQVALGALVKGRASSKALNAELAKSIPVVIGSDLYPGYGYWPSKLNRADGPTRHADPDEPDQALPWWWPMVIKGDVGAFDAWLVDVSAKLEAASTDSALAGAAVDLRTGRRVSYEERCLLRQRGEGAQREAAGLGALLRAELCGRAPAVVDGACARVVPGSEGGPDLPAGDCGAPGGFLPRGGDLPGDFGGADHPAGGDVSDAADCGGALLGALPPGGLHGDALCGLLPPAPGVQGDDLATHGGPSLSSSSTRSGLRLGEASRTREPTGCLHPVAVEILGSFDPKQVLFGKGCTGFYEAGCLDLYSGVAGVARALARGGCPWVVTFELSRAEEENVLLPENKRKIVTLIELKAVKAVGSALVCRSFSVAITPPIRTPRFPRGVPWASRNAKVKLAEGNAMSDFDGEIHRLCEKSDPIVFFWTENPDASFLWRQRSHRKFRDPNSEHVCRVDYCRFGTAWRKRTRVATNLPKLKGFRMLCQCCLPHVPLRGQHPTLKKPWTAVAQPYPRGFAKLLASGVLDATGWGSKFDLAACARCGSARIGEAQNPGPRHSRPNRNFSLEEAPVQTWATLRLGDQRWELFVTWARGFLSGDPVALFLQVPLFLAHAIRRYGDHDFMAGGSLLYYRHLVLAAQRKIPNVKPFIGICWDLATRWEKVEPVKHRVPVPEVLVEAMVALAWNLGWTRWCGVTLLCFFGVARAGEVLRCRRSDLLLPIDMMFECQSVFLLLQHSKTMYRQSARVQHLKVDFALAVHLLTRIYLGAERDEQLFHGSARVYRQRWDFLLKMLLVPTSLRVTPGGLRGGGAVAWYRKGGSITELMWMMRLKQISTLEAYLQEVSAISLLTDLPASSRRAIRAAASLFQHLRFSLGV